MIALTDNADIHLSSVINENIGMYTDIRLAVNSGGCSGFTYDWQLTSSEEPGDHVIKLDSGKLLIDTVSLLYLEGMTIDYKKDIFGQRLMIDNPNVKSSCGCGESFQV
jgi:iron-sulfur cluster assembly accessory protein|tara:strand:+ start:1239 stop:1562 length:324 start_codon:yes stop_codon:yes gene_type:complete